MVNASNYNKVEGSEDKLLANIKYYTLKYSNTKRFQQVKEKKRRTVSFGNDLEYLRDINVFF